MGGVGVVRGISQFACSLDSGPALLVMLSQSVSGTLCGSSLQIALAMMTSVLVSPEGNYEYEAAHGTVTRHYYRYLKGEDTSTNPIATIFAWSGALRKRGELDGLLDLVAFADKLEAACIKTLDDGIMTKDLVGLVVPGTKTTAVNSKDFILAIKERLSKALA